MRAAAVLFLILCAAAPLRAGDMPNPEAFLGPAPGETYVYRGLGEVTMIWTGLSRLDGRFVLREKVALPPDTPAGKAEIEVEREVALAAEGARLVLESGGMRRVLLDVERPYWKVPVMGPAGVRGREMACRIAASQMRQIFGRERLVVSVVCEDGGGADLAEGIGVLRFRGTLELEKIRRDGD